VWSAQSPKRGISSLALFILVRHTS
jgi:hypothetical protein